MSGSEDPLSVAALVVAITTLLGIIYRELRGQIADRDRRIEKLEAAVETSMSRNVTLTATSDRMLQYFLDREEHRTQQTAQQGSTP